MLLGILLIYLVMGSCAGVLAGLLGIGGGAVLVPGLLAVFALQGVEAPAMVHQAIATSLACVVFTALSSIRAHHRRGSVDWRLVARLAPGLLTGSLLGAVVADQINGLVLQRIFGAAALLIGLRMVFQRGADGGRLNLPGRVGLTVTGTGIGGLSALIGIGGGSLTVPWLSASRVPMVRAVGTSAACGLPIALAGVAGFVLTGWHEPGRMPHSIGYVLWPAVIGITVASMLAAPVGARLAHWLPARQLKRGFGVLLCVIGLRLAFAA
mgnify:FL=1